MHLKLAVAPVTEDSVRRALSVIPADDRDLWVRMGMAVKSELGEDGFAIWDEWSQSAQSYNAKDARDVWRSFKGGSITIGTLFHVAKQHGFQLGGEDRRIDPAEKARYEKERAEAIARAKAADEEREKRYGAAADKADELLEAAKGDPTTHPYAVRKKSVPLGPHAKRGPWPQRGWPDALLLPIYHADCNVWSIEAISPEGEKDSLKNGRKAGGIFPIGKISNAALVLIGEGAATVAAGTASTGFPGAAALGGSLITAGVTVRKLAPKSELVFLADYDPKGDGDNTGLKNAMVAAKQLGGRVAIPALGGRKGDFWDVWSEHGPEAVRLAIEAAQEVPAQQDANEPAERPAPMAEGTQAPQAVSNRPAPRPIDWLALSTGVPPERRWAVKGWIGFGHVTLLVGQGAIGKTLLAQQIASSLALGLPFVDDVGEPLRVLMWACEDDHDEMWRRQVNIARYQEAALSAYAENLVIVPRYGAENTLVSSVYGLPTFTPLLEDLREQANDLRADVVILDNIAQLYGAGENDRHAVTMFQNGLSGALGGRAVLLLGHPARAAGSEFSGSSAWENAARTRLYLGDKLPDQPGEQSDEPAQDVRYLARRKANYSTRDWRRFTFKDGVLVPDAVEAAGANGGIVGYLRDQATDGIVLSGLKKLHDMGMWPTEGQRSPRYLPRMMLDYKLGEGRSKAELGKALRRLIGDGRLKIGPVGTYGNRSPMLGLVIVE